MCDGASQGEHMTGTSAQEINAGRTTERDVPSICRVCHSSCGVMVRLDGGRVVSVTGDRENPMSQGYICAKGRQLPAMLNHPDRVLRPLARRPDATFETVTSEH